MSYKFELEIDGDVLPPPSDYTYTEADLHANTQRNAEGYASWDVVRMNVGTLEIEWQNLHGEKLVQVIQAIRNKKEFKARFFNTLTGKYEVRTFYSGDRSSDLVRFISPVKYWGTLRVPFVEV